MSDAPRGSRTGGAIDALSTLPVFFKLKGRRVVLAGGSAPAVWKAELLAATGAEVTVFDPAPCPEMLALSDRLDGSVAVETRAWVAPDLIGAALAIGALEGEAADAFREAAREAGVPVNVIDVPDLCDFQFGTIIERSPLLIAISTDGAAPVFGQALRARIEALLPQGIKAWARAAKDWRPSLQARHLGFSARRRYWEVFAERALAHGDQLPTEADREACLSAALATAASKTGALSIVGLGPGDPDLVTLKAIRLMQSADVIVHATDVDPAIIALGRREAGRISELATCDETARLAEALVEGGKTVVWAALGDPSHCARWRDRRAALMFYPTVIVAGLRCDACPQDCASRR